MNDPVVLITGASGMLGQALARKLERDFTLVGVDVQSPPDERPLDAVHHMDVTSDLSVREALESTSEEFGKRLAAVVHLAAYYDFTGEDSPRYEAVTVQGTRRLLERLRPFEVERFVFSSTMLVHAPVKPGEQIDEQAPLDPRWPYPESKVKTERVIQEHEPHLPHTHLRIAGVYTDFGKQPTLVHQITRIYERRLESFFFPGDSRAGQSLVHLEDAVDAIARTVRRRRALPDGPILIGEPEPLAYADLQDRIGELVWGGEWATLRVPEAMAKAVAWVQDKAAEDGAFIKPFMIEMADDHYALDIGRARTLLGWEPEHRLEDVLPKIVARLQADPARWYERNGLEAPRVEAESVRS